MGIGERTTIVDLVSGLMASEHTQMVLCTDRVHGAPDVGAADRVMVLIAIAPAADVGNDAAVRGRLPGWWQKIVRLDEQPRSPMLEWGTCCGDRS